MEADNAQPPYELRPGTGRRGLADLWERLDAAVIAPNRGLGGADAAAVADGFGELAQVAGELADAVARTDGFNRGRGRPRTRRRDLAQWATPGSLVAEVPRLAAEMPRAPSAAT